MRLVLCGLLPTPLFLSSLSLEFSLVRGDLVLTNFLAKDAPSSPVEGEDLSAFQHPRFTVRVIPGGGDEGEEGEEGGGESV